MSREGSSWSFLIERRIRRGAIVGISSSWRSRLQLPSRDRCACSSFLDPTINTDLSCLVRTTSTWFGIRFVNSAYNPSRKSPSSSLGSQRRRPSCNLTNRPHGTDLDRQPWKAWTIHHQCWACSAVRYLSSRRSQRKLRETQCVCCFIRS